MVHNMRYLIGFADTEGMPQNKRLQSSLWNMYVMFRYTVDVVPDAKLPPKVTKCLHSTHIAMEQKVDHEMVKKPLACHLASVDYIKFITRADKVLVCFWNAPHDRRVISYYGLDLPFTFVDLLSWARKFKYEHDPPIDSFSLRNLVDRFDINQDKEQSWNTAHTGLGDVLTMMDVIPKVSKADDEYSLVMSLIGLPYVKTTSPKKEPEGPTKPVTRSDANAKTKTMPSTDRQRTHKCGPRKSKEKDNESSSDEAASVIPVNQPDAGEDTRRADTIALATELLRKLLV